MALSPRHLAALQNLASKQAGAEVDWINIADARALTELGLADRSQEGWRITAAGLSALQAIDVTRTEGGAADPGEHQVIQMKKVDHEGN